LALALPKVGDCGCLSLPYLAARREWLHEALAGLWSLLLLLLWRPR
jgi:hypothetical protein